LTTELVPISERRIVPAQPHSERSRAEIVHRINAVRDGDYAVPVTVRVVDGVVKTDSLLPSTQRRSFVSTLLGAPSEMREEIRQKIQEVRESRELVLRREEVASIVAIIPASNEEHDIAKAIESLLLQTRPVDRIVVMVNNSNDDTATIARQYEKMFPNVTVDDVPVLDGGKPAALDWAWYRYAAHGPYTFVLGMDADVVADEDMVRMLEEELIHKVKAGGIRAKYSFQVSPDLTRSQKRLVLSQRAEFAMTEIKQQLRRGRRTEILGGQATLFRAEALREVANVTDGKVPWSVTSAVEDAELTRSMQRLKYQTLVSAKARAWVGPMVTPHAWNKQRHKWECGHLKDMIQTFHPWLDRRRWLSQTGMAWNLLIRMLFLSLLTTSILLEEFHPAKIWLELAGIPVGLAILQNVLVASRLPNRRASEILRAFLFVPNELYMGRTLSVFVASVIKTALDIRNNLWVAQAEAETSNKEHAFFAWVIIGLIYMTPIILLMAMARFIPSDYMAYTLRYMWWFLTVMTAMSSLFMLYWILRIGRRIRSLQP
jgi:biofilm PGA synthesis N-glycosyltransferase PgaC